MGCTMLKNLVITAAILISAATVQALPTAVSDILPNGSVARCKEGGDAGSRAFRLTIKDLSAASLTLQVDTLVCLRLEGKMTLVHYALSEKQVYKNNGHVISYEYGNASLAVMNTDATHLFDRINLDSTKFTQDVTLNIQAVPSHVFDVGLQMLEVIKIDDKIVDQGMKASGSYRINLQD